MKLLISDNKICGIATDDYCGPNQWLVAPDDFDESLLAQYVVVDGVLTIPIPTTVSMRQARLALLKIGKLAEVDTVIDSLPEPQKSAARIEWEYALDVAREWPTLLALAPLLGLDDAALDALFVEAAKL